MSRSGPEALLKSLAAGNEAAFAALYDRYAGRLHGAALGMLGHRHDAEDAVQEVFVALARSRDRLASVDDLTAYLFTALRHAAGRVAKRRGRQPRVVESIEPAAADPTHDGRDQSPYGEPLARAVAALPVEQREVVTLKIDAELTFAQIAAVMDISPNTAASRYRYALEKLRNSLSGAMP